MQQTQAKRKVGGKHNRKFERRSRNRQPHTARPAYSGFAVSIVKTKKKRFRHIKYGFLQ